MRILIFTQFFPPEIGATQTRLATFASGLAGRGHEVEVICEVPNHPQGIIHDGYRGRPVVVRRNEHGYRITHVWVYTSKTKTTRTRLAFYGSYAAMATVVGAARPRPDVILASSPPLPVAAAAAAVAARHRVPWVMDVRDLWPAAAVALGELRAGKALRMARWLETRLYESAAAITVVTEPFRRAVNASAPDKTVHEVPNGTTPFWLRTGPPAVDRAELGLPKDRFVWLFAGNIGPAQDLGNAIEAAGLLDEKFCLVIVGDGASRRALEEKAAGLPAGSVLLRDQVPQDVARDYLLSADALLVSLSADPVFTSFVPSKLFDFCAIGRPVILAADGESLRLIRETGAAMPVEPGDPVALADALRRLQRDEQLRSRLAVAGQAFAREHARDKHVAKMVHLIEAVGRRTQSQD